LVFFGSAEVFAEFLSQVRLGKIWIPFLVEIYFGSGEQGFGRSFGDPYGNRNPPKKWG
jgi:hypothetical protein